jgi:outer membrane protein assembly factor BamA
MRSLFLKIVFLFFLVQYALMVPVFAQSYVVRLHSIDTSDAFLAKMADVPEKFQSQMDAFGYIQQFVPQMQERGFLATSIDSVGIQKTEYAVYVFLGNSYRWSHVSFDSIPSALLVSAAINTQQWEGRQLNPKQIAGMSEKLLQYCEDNGYPFAKVWLQDVRIDSVGSVNARFMLDRGPARKIDSIDIGGDVRISKNYLMHYLDLHNGDPYSEKKLRSVSPRLKELPFLQESEPWSVAFKLSDTRLHLHLKEKKANQLNAIVGLLPNNQETNKFLLTVDALFAFQNILGYGESINVTYQNLQYKSPSLKADLAWPYLFNTPLGADGHFDFYRKDTAYRRTALQLGLRYQLTATDYVRVFYQNQSNRLITVDTSYVLSTHTLPDNADVAANGGGLELVVNKTDYRINPRKGWQLSLSGSTLLRSVRKNDAITALTDASGFNFAGLYDSLADKSYQYHLQADGAYYFPLGRKMTLKTAYDGAYIIGKNLFRNELYQIGGFKLLRGFDEQSIYASMYQVASLELRLLLSQNSYVYVFSDNGYVQSDFNGQSSAGFYNGFGLGTTLETKSGLFTISYALGRSDLNPVAFKQSKIHFGYVAYF